jgi:hypothetical protein
MPTYRFSGKVLPIFKQFTMGGAREANWKDVIDPPNILEMKATLTINKGIIEVLCESNLPQTDEYDGQVHNRALDLAVAIVTTYGFAKGLGLTTVLETVIKPDGLLYNLHDYYPNLEALVTVLRAQEHGVIDVDAVLQIVLSDPTIFIAMTDLVQSLTMFKEAPVRCARAVDAIRHYMAPQNDRKAGWPAMQENLNLSEPFLKYITEVSKGPRHGDVKGDTFIAGQEARNRAWITMNRFLEFKKRGNQRLPLSEFRIL